jgi:hypothetical protein
MTTFVAKYDSSHLGPNRVAPCACTILPYIPEVLHFEYNGREDNAEERTVKKTQLLPREMPVFQAPLTKKRKQLHGCCLQYFIHQLKLFFTHKWKCSCSSAYIALTVYILPDAL